jgi:hypothetical protein
MDTAARQAEVLAQAYAEDNGSWETRYAELRRERTLGGYELATRFAPDIRAMLG